ncbi:MAG: ABC transporter ATP-binding protein [Nitrososphaerota archaeon]|nr:ABC transporter ATP-binding protein [Nitrososphaerota archaeon]MDG6917543.1 ABC transporter ATP-binding protein [Nitrososphaerota archaeon]MDG6918745.1 ABC transporter ATP-binding protein [Nitrososphaerota archaeon]MDG6946635.1 ABC transporter ATP-binding protein [Nitrososphaerota archaeon]
MLLDVKGLRVSYRTVYGNLEAIRRVDLSIDKGESVAVVGESGCGKSTFGHAIVRLLPPNAKYEGSVTLDGKDVLALKGHELRAYRGNDVFMIFQDPLNSLNPVKRVDVQMLEAVEMRERVAGREYDETKAYKDIVEGLTGVRMPDPEVILRRYPHELSGGQIQRVVIAMALVMKPKLLIADEPTSALDVTIQAQVMKLIKDLKKEYGMSVLFITHDMAVAYTVADKFLVMYAGELSEFGAVDKVVSTPLHPYTVALVNSIPNKSRRDGELVSIPGSPPNMISPPPGCRFNPRCPRVMDICRTEPPEARQKDERMVRCHLYD